MKKNSAASLLVSIGGTAALMGEAINKGLGRVGKGFVRPLNNPAGSKLVRQLARGKKGITCRAGLPIHRKPV